MMIKKYLFILLLASAALRLPAQTAKSIRLSRADLLDKIKGGWAGQTIGVTFGGPVEFRFEGTMINESYPLIWNDDYLAETMRDNPGLYDDIYMDLTFVDVFDRLGLHAPLDSFAQSFAHAGFDLWHQNQTARWQILHGRPSGDWLHNPHANDLGYQIEADYAGLMSPGLPNASAAINDRIGHIITYGEGWYGGVLAGAMYSLAFVSKDMNYIVTTALGMIPPQSPFRECIADVVKWHKQFPADWKQTWFEIQKKWTANPMCPEAIFRSFNIDAKVNMAYVVLALLYGNGDYTKTLEIATRCGQDADCNPSTAGGILGTMLGYEHIPDYWKKGLKKIEDIDFKYTTISLNKTYNMSFQQALQVIKENGGKVEADFVEIPVQVPQQVRWEHGFDNMYPQRKISRKEMKFDGREMNFEFDGNGFVIRGVVSKKDTMADGSIKGKVFVDGKLVETDDWSTRFYDRRYELCWDYGIAMAHHTVKVVIEDPKPGYVIQGLEAVVFADKPPVTTHGDTK
jgi:ADP-ribosylglycohydrolase